METRTARLSVGHSGGTAGAGSRNYKVTLPTKWIERLGLGVNNREMELALDGDRIIITPRLTAEEFAENAIKHGHSVYKFSFFDGDRLCSVIYADFDRKAGSCGQLHGKYRQNGFWQEFHAVMG